MRDETMRFNSRGNGGGRDETMRINSREERREGGAERRKKQERRSILDILDNVNLYT